MQHCFIEGAITRKDPELRKTASGTSLCTFTVCLLDGFGQNKRKDYVNCIAFGKSAENIAKFFKKHYVIQLTGKFQNNPYTKYTASNGKQYDLPNWQFVATNFSFPPKPKPDDAGEEESYASPEASVGTADSSMDDFSVVPDSEDLPF